MVIPREGKVRAQGAAVGASRQALRVRGHGVQASRVAVINLVPRVLRAQAARLVREGEVRKVLVHRQVRAPPQGVNSCLVPSKAESASPIVSPVKVDQGGQAVPPDLPALVAKVVHLNRGEVVGRVQVRANQAVEQRLDPATLPANRRPKATIGNREVRPRTSQSLGLPSLHAAVARSFC
jgi:hypothetical protein